MNQNYPLLNNKQISLNKLKLKGGSNSNANSNQAKSEVTPNESNLPSRTTFKFDQYTFSSDFCSGNMNFVYRLNGSSFKIIPAADNMNKSYESNHRMWFQFSLEGVTRGTTLTFVIENLNSWSKLQRDGYKPVFKNTHNDWNQVPKEVIMDSGENQFIRFSHTFTNDTTHQFAFSFPFSYSDCTQMLDTLQEKYQKNPTSKIYFHRQTLCKSYEGRPVECITISDQKHITNEKEDFNTQNKKSDQPFLFRHKKYCLISARVHPGELTGQWAFLGLLEQLLREDEVHGPALREHFVFKLIPIINVDGVSRGHYRMDSMGNNLNRFYASPSVEQQPNIFQIRELAAGIAARDLFHLQIDQHSHATKRGCFFQGNQLNQWQMVDAQYQAQLVAMNSVNFDYEGSLFSEKMMSIKDKRDNMSREGSGRVGIQRATRCTHCYTLECNQGTGRAFNNIAPLYDTQTDSEVKAQNINPSQNWIQDPKNDFQQRTNPLFPREIFKDVGAACVVGILDLINRNKVNRIVKSEQESLSNVQSMIAQKVLENPPFKMDYKLKKEVKPILASKEQEIFKRYHKMFNFIKKADSNNNNSHYPASGNSSKLPTIKSDNSRSSLYSKSAVTPSITSKSSSISAQPLPASHLNISKNGHFNSKPSLSIKTEDNKEFGFHTQNRALIHSNKSLSTKEIRHDFNNYNINHYEENLHSYEQTSESKKRILINGGTGKIILEDMNLLNERSIQDKKLQNQMKSEIEHTHEKKHDLFPPKKFDINKQIEKNQSKDKFVSMMNVDMKRVSLPRNLKTESVKQQSRTRPRRNKQHSRDSNSKNNSGLIPPEKIFKIVAPLRRNKSSSKAE